MYKYKDERGKFEKTFDHHNDFMMWLATFLFFTGIGTPIAILIWILMWSNE